MAETTEDLTLETGADAAVAPESGNDTTITPEAALETLKGQLADATKRADQADAARQEAERQTAAAREAVVTTRADKEDTELAMVVGAIDRVKQSQDVLKANYAAAAAAADWDAAAEAQAAMADAAAQMHTLQAGKAQMEAQAEQRKQQREQPVIADPVEQWAAQMSAQSAAWIRAHPEYARDPRLSRRLLAAHNLAETDGHAVDSADYFSAVEQTLGITLPGEAPPKTDSPLSEAAAVRETPPPAAPGNRGNGGTQSVRLSAEEREIAQLNGQTAEEYAAAKMALKKEGRIH